MLKLLQILFLGHAHKWKVVGSAKIVKEEGGIRYGTVKILQCEKCSKFKKQKILY